MAKVKDILKDTSVDRAIRKRKCHRKPTKHSITAGELCLIVKDPATGGVRNYCAECARPMLDNAYDTLHEIESQLYSNS